ncbi:glycosyltransferase family 2 protein [Pseudarthrobacter sp. PS3-L1]|uniref:glycosyltransferase family 2 protein n=1 Tax=Pseudarthrobacter sp. PS3-L1 TaxID=3046207 RepID=UPI0024B9BF8D|nr:glycosyltransferase family 2 protein [Pseudarthrobacter sp. PS3-L1]MDJ0321719.1 glycosyltransferase family 2 protein [Pseudarthrobacter sp. PS3-L1]
MNNVTLIHSFVSDDSAALDEFRQIVVDAASEYAEISIGLATNLTDISIPNVRIFPFGTPKAEMMNQLIAEAETSIVIIAESTAHPVLTKSLWKQISGLQDGSFLRVSGRLPTSAPRLSDMPHSEIDWLGIEFTKSIHNDSPIMYALTKKDLLLLRGFDERASFNDCLTMDLLTRAKRLGITRESTRCPQSFAMDLQAALPSLTRDDTPYSIPARESQKPHVLSDSSIFRNLENWSVPVELRPILVSVSVATRDRAPYLADSINSVLAQTFHEFELIIVDDGSEDNTEDIVRSFDDPRITYVRQSPTGISSARNRAADKSVGHFTAVHDDDDLMLPWRLATSLATITATERASYGSWVNFDDVTAEMELHITKRNFGRELVAFSGQTPGHATWLLPTALIRSIRYDESLTSSVDHNLAVRTVLSGLRWRHSEKVLFLRRIHPAQVSQTDTKRQRAAAVLTRYANSFGADHTSLRTMTDQGKALGFPAPADRTKLFHLFGAYLPDHLVDRDLVFQGLVGKKVLSLDLHDRFSFIAAETDMWTGKSTLELGGAEAITLADMVQIRRKGIVGCRFRASPKLVKDEKANQIPKSSGEVFLVGDRKALELKRITKIHPAGVLLTVNSFNLDDVNVTDIQGCFSAKKISVNFGENQRKELVLLGFKTIGMAEEFSRLLEYSDLTWEILVPSTYDFEDLSSRYFGIA